MIVDQQFVAVGERSGRRREVRRAVWPLSRVESRSVELADGATGVDEHRVRGAQPAWPALTSFRHGHAGERRIVHADQLERLEAPIGKPHLGRGECQRHGRPYAGRHCARDRAPTRACWSSARPIPPPGSMTQTSAAGLSEMSEKPRVMKPQKNDAAKVIRNDVKAMPNSRPAYLPRSPASIFSAMESMESDACQRGGPVAGAWMNTSRCCPTYTGSFARSKL